jgi:hypothetical protein
MTGSSGVSSTPRPFGSIADVSGILDHPLSRVMTAGFKFQTAEKDFKPVKDFSPVIASEAKQSIARHSHPGLLRRFAPRNDGAKIRHNPAISPRARASFTLKIRPDKQRAQGMPDARRVRSLVCNIESTRV